MNTDLHMMKDAPYWRNRVTALKTELFLMQSLASDGLLSHTHSL